MQKENNSLPVTLFSQRVSEAQLQWKEKKGTFTEFSQALDVPTKLTRLNYASILNSLPTYIPETLKRELQEKPLPLVGLSVFEDKRSHEDLGFPVAIVVPDELVGDGEQYAWRLGIQILNEIATDTLALDIMKEMGAHYQLIRLAHETRDLGLGSIQKVIRRLRKQFAESYTTFLQELVVAMLSGDMQAVDAHCQVVGYHSINQLAVDIGKNARYIPDILLKLRKNPNVFTRAIWGSISGGQVNMRLPGVISIHAASRLLGSVNLLIGSVNLQVAQEASQSDEVLSAVYNYAMFLFCVLVGLQMVAGTPGIYVHEVSHYLSHTENHFGLIPISYDLA
ncbi:hypothetical protein KBC79_04855 [Candidatus Woesebacteria bacterium]|nr:hypothetical protein [Candidatus Woesebacteria bacterium]